MRNAPLSVGFYADEDKSWADQDCLNLLPVKAELPGGRSELKLAPLAGLQEFAAYPDASRQRGGYVVEGRQFAVIDQSLCQILPSGSVSILGTIPGTSRCAFAHNQIVNGNQLAIATGTSMYVWNTVTSALAQVTDTGFMGGLLAKFLGARIITLDPARRFFQWSDLADAGEWNSSSFDASEFSPDRIRSIDTMGDDLVVLNERTIDFYPYTGATNAAFERRPNSLDRGCAASHATVKVDNALFFIGNDGSGYLLRGYQLQRITTHPIEQQWAECDLTKAYAFLHEFEGHKIVYVVMPDGLTWGYDVATNLWHRRGSYGMDRWRLAWLTPWNGGYYGGEFNSGRVFVLNKRYPLEGSACISREFSPGCLHQGGERLTLDALRLQVVRGPRVEASSVLPLAFDLVQDELSEGITIGGALADGAVGDTISHQYRTTGGVSPVTFAITSGSRPAGLAALTSGGLFTGTYTTAEHDNAWTVTATDAAGATATLVEAQYVLDMIGDFADGNTTDAYSDSVTGSEGTAPYTFAKTLGTLPTGLTLSSAGVLSGTATVEDEFTFSVTMTDAAGVTQTKEYTVAIAEFFLSLGPIAWWPAADGSGSALNEVIANRDGALSVVPGAASSTWASAITDNSNGGIALGEAGAQVTSNAAFDVASGIGEWSVCVSFKLTNASGSDPRDIFSNFNDDSAGRVNWQIGLDTTNHLVGQYSVSGGTRSVTYATPIAVGDIHRAWLKREADGVGGYDLILFLDGAEVDREAIPNPYLGAFYAGADGIYFGNGPSAYAPNTAWGGVISDAAIFAHAVSDADIATDATYFAAVP